MKKEYEEKENNGEGILFTIQKGNDPISTIKLGKTFMY